MPRTCLACAHSERAAIDKALVAGEALRNIAERVQMHRDAEQFKQRIPSTWIADIKKHYATAKPLFEYRDAKGRTRLAEQWYQPEAKTVRDLFKQVDLEKHYVEACKSLSGTEHSDAMAYFAMVAQAERKEGRRTLAIQSDLFIPHYLRNAFQYFGDILRNCNKGLAFTESKSLDDILGEGFEFYKADMISKGIVP
jgi:hypothetical protein